MEKNIDERIQELIEETSRNQAIAIDPASNRETAEKARKAIKDGWYAISELRRQKAKAAAAEEKPAQENTEEHA